MRIAVNTRLLLKDRLEGIGWFTCETLRRITANHRDVEFFFIFDRKYHPDFIFSDNITPLVVMPQARHPVLYYLWFEVSLPALLKRIKPDLFLSPEGYLSLRTPVPSMNVIHDLNFEHNPGDLPWRERKYYRHFFPRYARKARRIATVSEYSRQDIVRLYGVPEERIDVVYNGAHEGFRPLGEEQKEKVRMEYTGGVPYFIYVGALHRRKNLANLFRAYDLFRESHPAPFRLLMVGARMWWTEDLKAAYESMKHREEVIFTGRLIPEDLHRVMASAVALTYVSYFEGFGIPIVEAFNSGVPVITSNVTSMPEVAGDAALLTDPFMPASISEAMLQIATDSKMRGLLIEKGIRRGSMFSWERSADLLWDSMMKACREP
ncbi:MAG: glycosyltransferase family 4 protein [Bacteroidales bacterium]|nr:glycosyltransferase family 4 protein [Bacteroidales bacterium]